MTPATAHDHKYFFFSLVTAYGCKLSRHILRSLLGTLLNKFGIITPFVL